LIIFTSDHGEMLYDRGMHQKSMPYDGASRIPFIVRYPAKAVMGSRSEAFVDLLDIMPTCLDVCGLAYPQGEYSLVGDSVFAEHPKRDRTRQISCFGVGPLRWVMNRDHRYKYAYYYNGGTEELYDMLEDPQEMDNLIGTDGMPKEAYARLKAGALDFEREWAPEGVVQGDSFTVAHGGTKTAGMHGNIQFHRMDRRSPEERGERFIEECEYAMQAAGNHGKKVDEVFNDPEYIDRFMKHWQPFGGKADALHRLFRGEPIDGMQSKRMGRGTQL
jgi:hypothetical protein